MPYEGSIATAANPQSLITGNMGIGGGGLEVGGGLSGSGLSGLLGAGAGLIGLLNNNQSVPYTNQLQGQVTALGQVGASATGEAAGLYSAGSGLLSALTTGQLPGGANDVVNQLVQQQTADTKAKYASLGQTGSTMEQSALNDINTNKGALTFQIAQQMAQTGLEATQQSLTALNIGATVDSAQASIYENLMKAQMTSNTNMMSSISTLASGLAKALPAVAAA